MKEKRKFKNYKLVRSSVYTFENKIGGTVDVSLNFTKGTAKVKTETITIKFNNLAEANMYGRQLIIEFDDGSNIVLEPESIQSPNKDKTASEDTSKDESVNREERPQKRTKDETFETKERTETRAFMGLKLDPALKKIIDGYSKDSNKIMEMAKEYLEIYDNASNASVMLAARQARFYEILSMVLGDFAKISPEFFKLLSREITEENKRMDDDKDEEEKKIKEWREKTVKLESEVKKLEDTREKLEEEKEDIKGRIKALRSRELEILHEEGIKTVEDVVKEEDDK